MRCIISTIGTSIFTNLIDRGAATEGDWFGILRDSANLKQNELESKTEKVISTLASRALEKLLKNDVVTNRRLSAELNGIYGIYGGQLPQNSSDQHYLICTDTAQGQQTGTLIKDFLESQGFMAGIVTPSQLSTENTKVFAAGTKELIKWLEENVSWQRDSEDHQVIFNLVGGFKSLQGYMQTFGTFYADESVYIFEGSSELIKIPRLPVQIDTTSIEKNTLDFAMMAAGGMYPIEELEGVPETLLETVEDNNQTFAWLSAWGELVWHRTKSDLLVEALLPFPRLKYLPRFHDDFNNQNEAKARLELQETLAEIAYILEESDGDTAGLERGGFRFKRLRRFPGIFTFRVARGIRVSCSKGNGGLQLHRYGPRNTINNNPN